MLFELPSLPYPANALAPTMSEETFSFHYSKHHAAYINNLNRMTDGTEMSGTEMSGKGMADKAIEQIIAESANDPSKLGLFNNAAQAWNHNFFWHSMSPDGGGEPAGGKTSSGALAEAVVASFGSYDGFCEEFTEAAACLFGSGWVWLAAGEEKLSILTTSNADIPLAELRADALLLTLDVWEHAYYLDFQNDRPSYIARWIENLINWEFATENYAAYLKTSSKN